MIHSQLCASNYDFYSDAPSGQRIYYKKLNSTTNPHQVKVTFPNTTRDPWGSYTKPSGSLQIPITVTKSGTTYTVVEIGNHSFEECTDITNVSLPPTISEIGSRAFKDCSKLEGINLENVQIIEDHAFKDCSNLEGINLENVQIIGQDAFRNCVRLGLESNGDIYLSSTLTKLKGSAFAGCQYIESFTVNPSNERYKSINGIVYSSDGDTLFLHPAAKDYNAACLEDVYVIGDYAFYGSTVEQIGELTTVYEIRSQAFGNCNNISQVEFPSNGPVKIVSTTAFDNCYWLTYADFSSVEEFTATNTTLCLENLSTLIIGARCANMPRFTTATGPNLSLLICKANTPPVLHGRLHLTPQCDVRIPCGSYTAYMLMQYWNEINTYEESFVFEPNPYYEEQFSMGHTTVLQEASCDNGSIMRLKAEPFQGYEFVRWDVYGDTVSGSYVGHYYDNPLSLHIWDDFDIKAVFQSTGHQGINEIDNFNTFKLSSQSKTVIVENVEGNQICVYTTTGRCIYQGFGENHIQIPVPNAGIYLVCVMGKGTKKIAVLQQNG